MHLNGNSPPTFPTQHLILCTCTCILYIETYPKLCINFTYMYLFPLDMSCSSDSDELKLRLSLLPPWAQKQMLSRPSVAQSVSSATAAASSATGGGGRGGAQPHPRATVTDTGETAAPLEGKWAQVSGTRHLCTIYVRVLVHGPHSE